MWIIHEPKKVVLWNKRHFEEKNGECAACLKYSVLIFVEKKYIKCSIWRVAVRPSYIYDARFLKVNKYWWVVVFLIFRLLYARVVHKMHDIAYSQRLTFSFWNILIIIWYCVCNELNNCSTFSAFQGENWSPQILAEFTAAVPYTEPGVSKCAVCDIWKSNTFLIFRNTACSVV